MHWAEKGVLIDFKHLSLGLKSSLYLAPAGTDFLSHVAQTIELKTHKLFFFFISAVLHWIQLMLCIYFNQFIAYRLPTGFNVALSVYVHLDT